MEGTGDLATTVDHVLRSRKTVRAFKPDPVSRAQVFEIIDVARTAPSTFNTQPWRLHVLTGEAKRSFSEAVVNTHFSNTIAYHAAIPQDAPAEFLARQNDFGRRYYDALGIDRSDLQARSRQTARNYVFFDAPVGLLLTIDAGLTKHSWLDCGLFLENIIIAAQARGLATIAQVSFTRYQTVIASALGLRPNETVVCGVSLGYPVKDALLNRLDMPREPVDSFTQWHGFKQ
jgi:nitroreductase